MARKGSIEDITRTDEVPTLGSANYATTSNGASMNEDGTINMLDVETAMNDPGKAQGDLVRAQRETSGSSRLKRSSWKSSARRQKRKRRKQRRT